MPLQIVHQDITKIICDVIVNPTDSRYSGGGGTDAAVHQAAGEELAKACRKLPPLQPGTVISTPAFHLPGKAIIHTVGPVWQNGDQNEAVILRSCYVNALLEARRLRAESIAFPLISSGSFRFPKDKVLKIATDAISDFLLTSDQEIQVFLCVLDRRSFETENGRDLERYLKENRKNIPKETPFPVFGNLVFRSVKSNAKAEEPNERESVLNDEALFLETFEVEMSQSVPSDSLSDWIKKQDDTFAVTLMKLIDKKGMDDVECYKKANVTKNTFSKIRTKKDYRPSKQTAVAFAVALQLTLPETEALLKSAGLALARNNTFDMIIEYYISRGIYDIFVINSALFQHDAPCLGC